MARPEGLDNWADFADDKMTYKGGHLDVGEVSEYGYRAACRSARYAKELEARIENIFSGIPYSPECFRLRERNAELEARIERATPFLSQPNELEGLEKVDLIRLMTEAARILCGEGVSGGKLEGGPSSNEKREGA